MDFISEHTMGLDAVELASVKRIMDENPGLLELPLERQREMVDAMVAEVRKARDARRKVIGLFEASRDALIRDRREIEARWVDDINQYEGDGSVHRARQYGIHDTEPGNKTPRVNLTRARTNTASARIADMLFPANDRNWDVQPLDDDLLSALAKKHPSAPGPAGPPASPPGGTGSPPDMPGPGMTPGDDPGGPAGHDINQRAVLESTGLGDPTDQISNKDRCDAMRITIKNQLDESSWSEHGRRMIEDGCRIGTGVLKGPFTRKIRSQRFRFQTDREGRHIAMVDMTQEHKPQMERVDPRFFYPENVNGMTQCERVFQLHLLTRSSLKELADQDGIDAAPTQNLIRMEPVLGEVGTNLDNWNGRCCIQDAYKDRYAVWEMHGILSIDELVALGMDKAVIQDMDETTMPVAEVWFCQGEVLRLSLSVLDADRRPPYWTWNYERAEDSIYGYGIPWLYRNPQNCIDSLWTMLMYNMSVSSGPQVFYKKGLVRPKDGNYHIRGPKIWEVTNEETDDISKVFRSEVIANNASQLVEVLNLAMKLGDEEISLPSIASGHPTESVPTASGLIQLMNASNIVQRRCAKSMDDDVISPMVERFYVWNMLQNENDDIKGDYTVSARGTSVLLHKDIKAQHLQVIAQITQDPRFAPWLNDGEFLREMFDSADVSSTLLLRTDKQVEAIRQNQAQAQAGGSDAADQAKTMLAQATIDLKKQELADARQRWEMEQQSTRQRWEMEQQSTLQERQAQRQHQQMLHDERLAMIQDKSDERKARLYMKQMEIQIMAAKLAAEKNISLAEIEKDLHIAQMTSDVKEFTATMDARIKAAAAVNAQREIRLKLDPRNTSGTGI